MIYKFRLIHERADVTNHQGIVANIDSENSTMFSIPQ